MIINSKAVKIVLFIIRGIPTGLLWNGVTYGWSWGKMFILICATGVTWGLTGYVECFLDHKEDFDCANEKVEKLNYRIKELEEKICPCESHDWVLIDSKEYSRNKESNKYTYKCKKCLKEKTTNVKDIKDY